MTKTGRNDGCPCGSGKKYKKCCLAKDTANISSLGWRRMRQAEGELVHTLLEYAMQAYSESAIEEAWDEFSLWEDVPLDPESQPELDTSFLPWFLFNWVPDNAEIKMSTHLPEQTIAEHYMQAKGRGLDAFKKGFIEATCQRYYSFFVVEAIDSGRSLTLRDLITSETFTVVERQASKTLSRGFIVYTRIVTMNKVSIMVGCAPIPFSAYYLNYFINLRDNWHEQGMQLTQAFLCEYEIELRELYYELREQTLNPSLPEMQNTDGEAFQSEKLFYVLKCPPQEAFDKLMTLSLTESKNELLNDAKFDGQGALLSVNFAWLKKGNRKHSNWENTVLGHIFIQSEKLTIEVNSRERAEAIKRKITRRLGKQAQFKNAVIESTDRAIEAITQGSTDPAGVRFTKDNDEFQNLPEVQARLQELAQEHWRSWLDDTLPALEGESPRQAAKTDLGRERLEAMFMQFEQNNKNPHAFNADIKNLRKSLCMNHD